MAALLSSSRMGRCSHLNWTCAKSRNRSPRSLPTAELLGAGGIMDVDNGRHTGSLNSQFPKTVPDGWCIKKTLFFFRLDASRCVCVNRHLVPCHSVLAEHPCDSGNKFRNYPAVPNFVVRSWARRGSIRPCKCTLLFTEVLGLTWCQLCRPTVNRWGSPLLHTWNQRNPACQLCSKRGRKKRKTKRREKKKWSALPDTPNWRLIQSVKCRSLLGFSKMYPWLYSFKGLNL